MGNLVKSMKTHVEEGVPLPTPFRGLARAGAHFRRGQVSIIAAASGGGKSAIATHMVVAARPKIPTLYFSADTDKMTLGTRIAAGVMDLRIEEAERALRDYDEYAALGDATEHIWWCFDTILGQKDVEAELEMYCIIHGEFPHLIVLDNLINLEFGNEAGHIEKDAAVHWLQQVASITNAHVMILHHVTGPYEDGTIPIPKSGLLDKVAKRPRLVLTLYRPQDNLMGVCIVKNSSGPAKPDGSLEVDLAWLPEKSYLSG